MITSLVIDSVHVIMFMSLASLTSQIHTTRKGLAAFYTSVCSKAAPKSDCRTS